MSSSSVALVPLRSPGAGKTRLAAVLDGRQRAELAEAMLADVASALSAAPVDRTVVVAGGASAAAVARRLGLEVVLDPPGTTGLDTALTSARARLGPRSRLLVVTADLPRLTADEVAELLAVPAAVVVAATHDGGTGGLLLDPPEVIEPAYGAGSARRHLAAAGAAGVEAATVRLPGFTADVDTVRDLEALTVGEIGPATRRWVARHGLGRRAG